MIETSVMYVSSRMSVKVFRIEAPATMSGKATAGSVPKVKSRMTSAPSAPISVSTRMLGPLVVAAARLVVERVDPGQRTSSTPAGAARFSVAETSSYVARLNCASPGG